MEDSTKRLIDIVAAEPQLRKALEQICEFKWVRINEISRYQLQMLEEEGFKFHKQTLGSRKEDIKQYLKEHPECRAPDANGILDAIGYRLLLEEDEAEPEYTAANEEAERRHQARMQERMRRSQLKKKPKQTKTEEEVKEDSSSILEIEESENESEKETKAKKKTSK